MGGRATEVGSRLRHARERSGLTMTRVKERAGIGESSLSEFENGKREPSLSQLTALARAYRRPVSFFFASGPLPKETVLWRQRPQAEAEEIEQTFLRLCGQFHNLEMWCGSKATTELPFAPADKAKLGFPLAEELAKQVRRELALGERPGLALLRELEERCGVKVFHHDFEPTGTAACALGDSFGPAVLLNSKNARWRRNFDLAHELFHLLTWHVRRGGADSAAECSADEERFADAFASNLLMPGDAVRSAVNSRLVDHKLSMDSIFEIAREFDVSLEALLWRLHWIYRHKQDEPKTRHDIEVAKSRSKLLEERDQEQPPARPARFRALALTALQRGELAIGRFAEYMAISRREAMGYIEQESAGDEAIELASA